MSETVYVCTRVGAKELDDEGHDSTAPERKEGETIPVLPRVMMMASCW
jgi:hypothetical protein